MTYLLPHDQFEERGCWCCWSVVDLGRSPGWPRLCPVGMWTRPGSTLAADRIHQTDLAKRIETRTRRRLFVQGSRNRGEVCTRPEDISNNEHKRFPLDTNKLTNRDTRNNAIYA